MKKPSAYARHDVRKYQTRRSHQWIDYRGQRKGRLLCLEWVGRWHSMGFWKCQCDCGRECIVFWCGRAQSCGCLQREARRDRSWPDTMRLDGTWGHAHSRKVTLPDGRTFPSIAALARNVGCSTHAMKMRLLRWPAERWIEPPYPRGPGEKLHRRKWMKLVRRRRAEQQEAP